LVFNSWEVDNLLFRFLFVLGLSGLQKFEKKLPDHFFTRRKSVSEWNKREGPQVQTSSGGAPQLPGRATYIH
jgi:hypothetical protein